MSKKFRSSHDYVVNQSSYEEGGGKLVTVPNEALSIQDILLKFSRGMDPAVQKTGVFVESGFDSPDMEKIRDSDLVDRSEYATALSRTNAATEKALKETIDKQTAARDAAKVAADKKQKRLDDIIAKEDARSKDDK